MRKTGRRLECRVRLDIEGELMALDLWRMPNNKMMAEIKEGNKKLFAFADTSGEMRDFVVRAYKLMKEI